MNASISSGRKTISAAAREIQVPPFFTGPACGKAMTNRECMELARRRWEEAGHEVGLSLEASGEISSDTINGLPACEVLPFARVK